MKTQRVGDTTGKSMQKSKIGSGSKSQKVNADRQSMGGKSKIGGRGKVNQQGNNPFKKARG